MTPSLLRTFRTTSLSAADALVAASEDDRARWYTPNHILLDNDMLVAAIGGKIFAWRAGSGKGRQGGKGEKKGGGKGELRAHGKAMGACISLDMTGTLTLPCLVLDSSADHCRSSRPAC